MVRGKRNAESELKNLDSRASSDRYEGWRYFIEKTDLKAGTDPAEATQLRQARIGRARIKSSAGGKDSQLPFARSLEMKLVEVSSGDTADGHSSNMSTWVSAVAFRTFRLLLFALPPRSLPYPDAQQRWRRRKG